MAPREEPGLPCSLGPRRKWGFQEATAFFLPFQRERATATSFFLDVFSSAQEVGPSSSLGRNWELRMKGPESIHSVSQWSPGPLLLTPNTKVHSFTQRILTEALLNARPGAQACLHK